MKVFLFIVSYIVLNIVYSLLYVGLMLLLFFLMKQLFNMNEEKWRVLFKFKKGIGIYSLMIFPHLVTFAIMFPVSMFTFELINFNYKFAGYISVVILPTLILLLKLPKLKEKIVN